MAKDVAQFNAICLSLCIEFETAVLGAVLSSYWGFCKLIPKRRTENWTKWCSLRHLPWIGPSDKGPPAAELFCPTKLWGHPVSFIPWGPMFHRYVTVLSPCTPKHKWRPFGCFRIQNLSMTFLCEILAVNI